MGWAPRVSSPVALACVSTVMPSCLLSLRGMTGCSALQTYEGGLGGEPGNEAHGGYTFCGLAALMLVGRASVLDLPSLLRWAVHRQVSPPSLHLPCPRLEHGMCRCTVSAGSNALPMLKKLCLLTDSCTAALLSTRVSVPGFSIHLPDRQVLCWFSLHCAAMTLCSSE